MKTLDIGNHTISIVSTTGTADASFIVTKLLTPPITPTPPVKNPQTGDDSTDPNVLIVLLIAMACSSIILLSMKNKEDCK